MTDDILLTDELEKLRFRATLNEYKLLKMEILNKFQDQLRMYSLLLGAMGVIAGYITTSRSLDMLLILPLISNSLAFRYFWEQSNIIEIGNYLKKLEYEVFPKLLGYHETIDGKKGYWVFWENYFSNNCKEHSFYKISILLLFVLLPNLLSLMYSLLVINFLNIPQLLSIQLVSHVPSMIHITLFIIYFCVGGYLTYMFITTNFLGESFIPKKYS